MKTLRTLQWLLAAALMLICGTAAAAAQPSASPNQVTVTLVRWPYT